MFGWVAMSNCEMSGDAWIRGCVSCEWWIWINLDMWFQWDGWYQNDMVLVWGEKLYSWLGMDELKWDSTRNVNEELVKKGWHESSYAWYMCLLVGWMYMFSMCQYINPWSL